LPADLSAGYDRFHRWDDSIDEHLVGLLKSIQLLEEKTSERLKVDVITWRGMITKVNARSNSDPVLILTDGNRSWQLRLTGSTRRFKFPGSELGSPNFADRCAGSI